ncbi:MAG: hypothetical protein J7D60_08715 [Prosthecochloris sp.]|nr:hypothetical protein [Prosthecochloris sp.]
MTQMQAETHRLVIERNWDGGTITPAERMDILFSLSDDQVNMNVDAPFYNDPPPTGAPGEREELWNHEVAELFLLGRNGRYLEIEIGPHGHYLVMEMHALRQASRRITPLQCTTRITDSRWQGTLTLIASPDLLPFTHVNGYAIHGTGSNRRYLAAFPVPGKRPDFHQPERFMPLEKPSHNDRD